MTVLISILIGLTSSLTNTFIHQLNNAITEIENSSDKVEIVIESNDQMRFNLSEITVQQGQTVVLTLKHVGKLPKAAMGHNWVLLRT